MLDQYGQSVHGDSVIAVFLEREINNADLVTSPAPALNPNESMRVGVVAGLSGWWVACVA